MKSDYLYGILSVQKLGSGVKFMDKNNMSELENKEAKLQKKFKVADAAFDAGALLCGLTATATIVSGLMGGAAAISSDLTMNHTATALYESDAYHASIRDRERKLTDDLVNGNISYVEFKEKLDKLYSVEEVINYSKTANDKELSSMVESYEKTKDMQHTMFTKALPTFGTPTVAGLAIAYIAGKARRKYHEEIVDLQGPLAEEEMAK